MIDFKVIDKLKKHSVVERIQIIEMILESIKRDISALPPHSTPPTEPFRVNTFSLGEDMHVRRGDHQ